MQLPGIATTVAATIIGETGDVNRFGNEAKFATFCGLTPICRQSGKGTGIDRLARQTNKHLLRAMYISALVSVRCFGPSNAYYERKLQQTSASRVDKIRARIALARYRCRVIYRILSREGYVYKAKQTDQPCLKASQDETSIPQAAPAKTVRLQNIPNRAATETAPPTPDLLDSLSKPGLTRQRPSSSGYSIRRSAIPVYLAAAVTIRRMGFCVVISS